ncbi:MAG: glycosyltransferase family 9 protein, partial [Candidatus Omnitrophica bacterium]|nr:glycosyltransferase family 9 protein [Candidatus Omnitrophota bacterium]
LHIYQHPKEVKQITAAAYQKVQEKYTIEHMAGQTVKVYKELLKMVNILVVKISSIGDVVLVTASLKALRAKYPRAKIYCLVGAESRKILSSCPYIDGIIVYDHKGKERGIYQLWRLSKKLRRYRFDKVVDFQNNRKSHLLAFLSMAGESYGFNNGKWARLLTHPLMDYEHEIPAVEHQFQVLKQLDIEYDPDMRLELWPTRQDQKHIDELFDEEWLGNARSIVGINISASPKWQTKNWPTEYIIELCDKLAAKNIRVILTGTPRDREQAKYIHENAKSKPTVAAGKTDILQLAVLIQRCKVFITPDSAPLHVAASVKTPVIALFGPTDSRRHVPPA